MEPRYVLSGMTSGTGDAVVRRLVTQFGPERLLCLVRASSPVELLRELGVPQHICDITQPDTYRDVLSRNTIYVDMTHPKFYGNSVETVRSAGVERAFWVTTTGIFSKYHSCSDIYQRSEETLRNAGITWTILRPSMIYGTPRDKNMHKLIKFLDRSPLFPIFGTGASLMQPVYVEDLAEGIVTAITQESAVENRAYNLAGPTPLSYRAIIRTVGRELEKRAVLLYIPMKAAQIMARLLEKVPGFPVSSEQVMRLTEDKAFDIGDAARELSYHPRPFEEGIRHEIALMREQSLIRLSSRSSK